MVITIIIGAVITLAIFVICMIGYSFLTGGEIDLEYYDNEEYLILKEKEQKEE